MQTYFKTAITRKPAKNFARGLSTSNLRSPDYDIISKQHGAYVETLRSIGLDVIELEEAPAYPDAHFVEDTAVVTPDVAVITNPGAAPRKGEEDTIAPVLAKYRRTARIEAPATVDGGDVLMVGKHFFIGISERTNKAGAEQLGTIIEDYGNTWELIVVNAGLHLKSNINFLGNNTLIAVEDFASLVEFENYDKIIVDPAEKYAANTLWINDHLLIPKGFPNTRRKLSSQGLEIIELDMSEVRKMDGGLTCLSLRF
jgi:dimethylargininase